MLKPPKRLAANVFFSKETALNGRKQCVYSKAVVLNQGCIWCKSLKHCTACKILINNFTNNFLIASRA